MERACRADLDAIGFMFVQGRFAPQTAPEDVGTWVRVMTSFSEPLTIGRNSSGMRPVDPHVTLNIQRQAEWPCTHREGRCKLSLLFFLFYFADPPCLYPDEL